MGALATALNNSPINVLPHELACFPNGESIREVWCGSEYTIACTDSGQLWSCGWNEHGNLGIVVDNNIDRNDTYATWKPVICTASSPSGTSINQQCRLVSIWDGALSCGGSHCIANLVSDIS